MAIYNLIYKTVASQSFFCTEGHLCVSLLMIAKKSAEHDSEVLYGCAQCKDGWFIAPKDELVPVPAPAVMLEDLDPEIRDTCRPTEN